jgi:predicted amidohydrolase
MHLTDEHKTTGQEPPRKIIVGTAMYRMWVQYPGLEKRLQELGQLIDEMAEQAAKKYPGTRMDIVALPEVAVNGEGPARQIAVPLDGPVLDAMGAKAREHRCYVIVPLYMVEEREKGAFSNAAALLDRAGNVAGVYRKAFPVGDPARGTLEGGVTPGKEFPVFECDFGRVSIQICYDISFDTGWEVLGRKGAELVIWTSQSPGQIRASCRALQNKYYVLTSTWRNNASLFDPMGQMVREIREPERVFVEQIDLSYVLLNWQRALSNGKAFDDKYGEEAGYRYSEAEDGGIFWSNNPNKPIMDMVRELKLELPADVVRGVRPLQDKVRGGPPRTK